MVREIGVIDDRKKLLCDSIGRMLGADVVNVLGDWIAISSPVEGMDKKTIKTSEGEVIDIYQKFIDELELFYYEPHKGTDPLDDYDEYIQARQEGRYYPDPRD